MHLNELVIRNGGGMIWYSTSNVDYVVDSEKTDDPSRDVSVSRSTKAVVINLDGLLLLIGNLKSRICLGNSKEGRIGGSIITLKETAESISQFNFNGLLGRGHRFGRLTEFLRQPQLEASQPRSNLRMDLAVTRTLIMDKWGSHKLQHRYTHIRRYWGLQCNV